MEMLSKDKHYIADLLLISEPHNHITDNACMFYEVYWVLRCMDMNMDTTILEKLGHGGTHQLIN